MNKGEDILAKDIEDTEAGKSSMEDYLDKYLSMCGQLEPLMRITLEIPKGRGNVEEI